MGLQREKAGRGTLAVCTSSYNLPLSLIVLALRETCRTDFTRADTNMLFAIILERIVFHQLPDVWSVLGASIIVAGAVRVALEKSKVKGVEVRLKSL